MMTCGPHIPYFFELRPSSSLLVKRSWKERLFSLPWKPLETWKPDHRVHLCHTEYGSVYFAHPETIARIKQNNEKFRKSIKNC